MKKMRCKNEIKKKKRTGYNENSLFIFMFERAGLSIQVAWQLNSN